MPELPEVETVCRGLTKALPGHRIKKVQQNRYDLRIPFPATLASIRGKKIISIARRAKYILIHLEGSQTLIIHLGMSGKLVLHSAEKKYAPEKHDHMVVTLENGTRMVFNDPRRFGLVDLAITKRLASHRFFEHLGPEPFDKKFTAAALSENIKNKKISIKLAIMDQTVVVGVGNIYAAEALFTAKIDPRRTAASLKTAEITRLVAAIRSVLKKAIKAGGSSLRDYVQTGGELGYFQNLWSVYDKRGLKCSACTCNIQKTGGVQRLMQGGRSTFYCPVKQE